MTLNLLNLLSETLQTKLSDFKISEIFICFEELHITSEYDLDSSYITAIEKELTEMGYQFID